MPDFSSSSLMPNITRTIQTSGSNKTKVLLVRQPVKSVRHRDAEDRLPVRLAIGVIVALGSIGLVWLIGFIGFRLGFAQIIGEYELMGEPGGGLASGAMILINLPLRIFEAGVAEPMWLMLGFLLIAIPGGGIAGVRNPSPGGPRPTQLFTLFTWTGTITACITALLMLIWVVSPLRAGWMQSLPSDLIGIDDWLAGLTVVAGLDGLLVITGALWVVLAMRLRVPTWMKGLSVSSIIVAMSLTLVAMSMSNGAVTQLHLTRSVAMFDDDPNSAQLLIGYTRRHAIMMHTSDGRTMIEMFDVPTQFTIARRTSIASMLLDAMPADEDF